jgi:hypothetical protein
LIKANPKIKARQAVDDLAKRGIPIRVGLFYLVKGNMAGRKKRRRRMRDDAVAAMSASGNPAPVKSDALATIRKVKAMAVEVGGMRTLKGIVDALSE